MRKAKNRITGTMDIILDSIEEADMSDMRKPIIDIYKNPEDYPDKYVARIFDVDKPTNTIILSDDLEKLHKDIRKTGMYYITRGKDDVPELVGAYM